MSSGSRSSRARTTAQVTNVTREYILNRTFLRFGNHGNNYIGYTANIWMTYILFTEYLNQNKPFGGAQYNHEFTKYNTCSFSIKSDYMKEAKSWILENIPQPELDRLGITDSMVAEWKKSVSKNSSLVNLLPLFFSFFYFSV